MSRRELYAQLLLFNVLLALSVATKPHLIAGEGDATSFLQVAAKVSHHASDAGKHALASSWDGTPEFWPFVARPSTDDVKLFCYALVSPFDKTAHQLREQMEGCDDYRVYSFYNNERLKTVKLFSEDEMTVGKTKGWADNARLMPRVLRAIVLSDLPETFTWFVKVDADSFFRPRFLYPILAKYNYTLPIALGTDKASAKWRPDDPPILRGAMETFSRKVFRHKNTDLLYDMNREGGEDNVISEQLTEMGVPILINDRAQDCNTMYLDYDNVPHMGESESPETWNTTVVIDTIREFLTNPDVTCKELPPVYDGTLNYVNRNVVIAHPIKDVETYKELQELDRKLQAR